MHAATTAATEASTRPPSFNHAVTNANTAPPAAKVHQ